MLKFHAFDNLIVLHAQARKPPFETKRVEACCNPHHVLVLLWWKLALGKTAAFSWGGRSFTAVKPQTESAF